MRGFDLQIHGERWRVRFVDRLPSGDYGECDHARRLIRVRRNVTPEELLATVIHEIMHALHPHHGEGHVLECERVLVTAVHRAGFRLPEDGPDDG